MLYNYFKIFHILSATLLLTSMAYCYKLWHMMQPEQMGRIAERVQNQTLMIIIPAAIMQLASGFTMISLQHYDLSELWLSGSVIGFIGVVSGWFGFVYFLLLAQQLVVENHHPQQVTMKYYFFRRMQSAMLLICALATLLLVFFMASRVK